MKKPTLILFLFFAIFLASCEPTDTSTPYVPVTQIPFYATDTPSVIIPITDTPEIIVPITDTPDISVPITDTPGLPPPVTETPTSPSLQKWWEVYFTDPINLGNPDNPAGSIEEKLIQYINGAQTSIHIASFEFNLPRVADALIAAKARGVDVRWITDDENGLKIDSQPGRGQFARLTAAGIEVKDDAGRSSLMHDKFWLFDGQVTWTGSTNITVNGIYKQNNNVIVIHSTDVTYFFEREWNEMWSGQFGPRAPSTVSNQWAILDGTPIQVLFSAEDNAMSNLVALVNDAKTNIRFLAFSFTDDPLGQAMIARAQAGVDVQGVFETFGSTGISSELKPIWCAGLQVRQDGNPSFLHDKILIIDNSIVVTGSLNFSSNADTSNEENIVILDNADIAALYLQEYQKLWDQGNNVPSGTFTCE